VLHNAKWKKVHIKTIMHSAIKLRHIRSFLDIADTGNLSSVARTQGISQPALSRSPRLRHGQPPDRARAGAGVGRGLVHFARDASRGLGLLCQIARETARKALQDIPAFSV